MTAETNGENVVKYTTKELLERVDARIAELAAQVDKLSDKVDGLQEEVNTFKRLFKIAGSALGVAVAVVVALIQTRGGL